jgi:hypothetical protein
MQLRSLSLLTLGALALAGCDKLTATTFAVSVLTRTPNLNDVAASAGISSTMASTIGENAIPQATAIAVGIGERDSITSTNAPTPVSGATVTLSFQDAASVDQAVSVCEVTGTSSAQGGYQATSVAGAACASAKLAYVATHHYTTTIVKGADTYTLDIVAPAALAASSITFDPDFTKTPETIGNFGSVPKHALNTELAVSWTSDKNVFVTVFRVNYNGADWSLSSISNQSNWTPDQTQPTWDNVPRDAAGMLDVITGTPATSVTVPASVFSKAGAYAVMVTRTEISSTTSSNLSVGSSALAGEGTGFVFIVK